jgi:UDP-N-acetylmuramate dehydrogenase
MDDLSALLQGQVLFDEPLAGYTTYRIGGPAAALVHPASADDVVRTLRFVAERGLEWMALGLGSNILVRDSGFDGVVIRLGKGLDGVEEGIGGDRHVWRVGAGLPTPILARRTAQAGLAGVQRLVGVPGTIGGGVYMNAGAHGQDFASATRSVAVIDQVGERKQVSGPEIEWRYRSSGLHRVIVLAATIGLVPAERAELEDDIRSHLEWRKEGTPFNEPCCGSVFRNPPPKALPAAGPRTAGQLIDAAGLKRLRIGGAEVSSVHANYIVNVGGASASDVLGVIETVRERVLAESGVELELEVQVVGEE